MMFPLKIVYTDGFVVSGPIDKWRSFPAEGIDAIQIAGRTFHGHALYWCYFDEALDGGSWIFGMASTYTSPPPPEVLFRATNGSVVERNIVTMPDLYHGDVKLGWWKRPAPGEDYVPGGGLL